MAVLSAEDRKRMPSKDFAGPDHTYPDGDPTHARLAISGASHAEHVGNISKSEEESIQAKARAKLGEGGHDDPPADHKAAISKMHPEHVHRLVEDAKAGKYGPEAQRHAQAATEGSPAEQNQDAQSAEAGMQKGKPQMDARRIFGRSTNPDAGAPEDGDQDDNQPMNARAIFGGRR